MYYIIIIECVRMQYTRTYMLECIRVCDVINTNGVSTNSKTFKCDRDLVLGRRGSFEPIDPLCVCPYVYMV